LFWSSSRRILFLQEVQYRGSVVDIIEGTLQDIFVEIAISDTMDDDNSLSKEKS
jgi:hypothetical protein